MVKRKQNDSPLSGSPDGELFSIDPFGETIVNYEAASRKIINDSIAPSEILNICDEKLDLEANIEWLEEQLKDFKERLTYLDEFVIPETLAFIGTNEIILNQKPDGTKTTVQIQNDYHARIIESRQDEAERILCSAGLAEKIQRKEIVSINSMTLKSFARQQIERIEKEGEKYPGEEAKLKSLFGIYKSTKAIIKSKKISKKDEIFL